MKKYNNASDVVWQLVSEMRYVVSKVRRLKSGQTVVIVTDS